VQEISVKYRNLCVPLLVACVFSSTGQATTAGGVISFHGSVMRPTSVPVAAQVPSEADPGTATTVESLIQARTWLSSDLLDYFAQYAKPHAKFVSVAYQ
jgi:hypothetical protein